MLAKVLKTVWILCALVIFVVAVACYTPDKSSDIGVLFVYGMLILAFPVSLLVAGLFALLALIQDQSGVPLLDYIDSTYAGFFVLWLAFFVAGFTQWFILLPWLWRKWKTRRGCSAVSAGPEANSNR